MFKTSWIIASVGMLTIWIVAGITLLLIKDSQFLTNWINSAVAIGTIGSVVTSLFLANKPPNINVFAEVIPDTEDQYEQVILNVTNVSNIPIQIYSVDIDLPGEESILFSIKPHNHLFNPFESKYIDYGLEDILLNFSNSIDSREYASNKVQSLVKLAETNKKLKVSIYSSIGRQNKIAKVINIS